MASFSIPLLTLKMCCIFLIANSRFVCAWICIIAKKSVRRVRSSWLKFIPVKSSFVYTTFSPRMLRCFEKKKISMFPSLWLEFQRVILHVLSLYVSSILSVCSFAPLSSGLLYSFSHMILSFKYSLLSSFCTLFESYAVSCVFFIVG